MLPMATLNKTHRSQDDGACVLEWQLGGEAVHRVLVDPVHGCKWITDGVCEKVS